MDAWKIILIVICLFNVVLCYACCVVSGRAEDAARKLYEKLEKEGTTENEKVLKETLISKIPDDDDRQYSGLWTEED